MTTVPIESLVTSLSTRLGRARELINEAWQPLMQEAHGGVDTREEIQFLQQRLNSELEPASEALTTYLEAIGAPSAAKRFESRWVKDSGDMVLSLDQGEMDYVSCSRVETLCTILESFTPEPMLSVALRAKQDVVKEAIESTPKIVALSKKSRPTNEHDLQTIVHEHMEATFPNYQRKVAVATSSEYYIPDGALPSLELGIEWKYVKDKQGLKKAIDEIKADIPSYGQSRQFTRFFGVFYQSNSSICTQQELVRAFDKPIVRWEMILVTAPS